MEPFSNACRLCLWKGDKMIDVFRSNQKCSILEKIHKCIPIKFQKSDVTHVICHNCYYKLEIFAEFLTVCSRSDVILKRYIESQNMNSNDESADYPDLTVVTVLDSSEDGVTDDETSLGKNRLDSSKINTAVKRDIPRLAEINDVSAALKNKVNTVSVVQLSEKTEPINEQSKQLQKPAKVPDQANQIVSKSQASEPVKQVAKPPQKVKKLVNEVQTYGQDKQTVVLDKPPTASVKQVDSVQDKQVAPQKKPAVVQDKQVIVQSKQATAPDKPVTVQDKVSPQKKMSPAPEKLVSPQIKQVTSADKQETVQDKPVTPLKKQSIQLDKQVAAQNKLISLPDKQQDKPVAVQNKQSNSSEKQITVQEKQLPPQKKQAVVLDKQEKQAPVQDKQITVDKQAVIQKKQVAVQVSQDNEVIVKDKSALEKPLRSQWKEIHDKQIAEELKNLLEQEKAVAALINVKPKSSAPVVRHSPRLYNEYTRQEPMVKERGTTTPRSPLVRPKKRKAKIRKKVRSRHGGSLAKRDDDVAASDVVAGLQRQGCYQPIARIPLIKLNRVNVCSDCGSVFSSEDDLGGHRAQASCSARKRRLSQGKRKSAGLKRTRLSRENARMASLSPEKPETLSILESLGLVKKAEGPSSRPPPAALFPSEMAPS